MPRLIYFLFSPRCWFGLHLWKRFGWKVITQERVYPVSDQGYRCLYCQKRKITYKYKGRESLNYENKRVNQKGERQTN